MSKNNSIVLLIAHGSRKPEANAEVLKLASDLSQIDEHVIGCFLEIAKPDIPSALIEAIQLKPQNIKILPYFLTRGRHVTEDIPHIIKQTLSTLNTDISIEWLDYLGSQTQLKNFLHDLIKGV